MIQAPFQLRDYWVDFIQVRVNKNYQQEVAPDLDLDSIELNANVRQVPIENPEELGTLWLTSLVIQQHLPEGKNIPYEFTLDMSGWVAAHPSLEGEKLERMVQVNGPTMLFGAAREIIRAATGRGKFAPVIIPSTNFLNRLPDPKAVKELEASKPAKKKPTGKTAKKTVQKRSGKRG